MAALSATIAAMLAKSAALNLMFIAHPTLKKRQSTQGRKGHTDGN